VAVDRFPAAVYMSRPAAGQSESSATLFRLLPGSREAERVQVRFGRGSASTLQVMAGLRPGDVVILSDMTPYAGAARVT
jgi:hypothetical protein